MKEIWNSGEVRTLDEAAAVVASLQRKPSSGHKPEKKEKKNKKRKRHVVEDERISRSTSVGEPDKTQGLNQFLPTPPSSHIIPSIEARYTEPAQLNIILDQSGWRLCPSIEGSMGWPDGVLPLDGSAASMMKKPLGFDGKNLWQLTHSGTSRRPGMYDNILPKKKQKKNFLASKDVFKEIAGIFENGSGSFDDVQQHTHFCRTDFIETQVPAREQPLTSSELSTTEFIDNECSRIQQDAAVCNLNEFEEVSLPAAPADRLQAAGAFLVRLLACA